MPRTGSSCPPYVGSKGWVGVALTVDQDWDEIADLIEDSYRLVAPKRLSALLPERPPVA
jgi:predicted DNA-binding protein (MmcQ/YjbR family)